MGSSFRWLLASQWVTNLADGIAIAAGPLLVASQTRDAGVVALATLVQRLPWLLFGLPAGVAADRIDRRRLAVGAATTRAIVAAVLVGMIAVDRVDVTIALLALFAFGTTEVFVDTTAATLLPTIVDRADLGIGNARLSFGRRAINELAGPPLGAAMFAVGLAVPFVAEAVIVAFGAVLLGRIRLRPVETSPPGSARRDVIEGFRWLWNHPPVRTLTLTVVLFNITFGAMWPLLVLYSLERLGTGELGFGLLLAASAVGGIVGAMAYGPLEQRFGAAQLMRAGLITETLFHLALALTTAAWLAGIIMFVFGIHTSVWGTTATSIRQRAVPDQLQGRVGSVYMLGVFGGLAVGGVIGAAIATRWGVLGPFWFAFVGSALLVVAMWHRFSAISYAEPQGGPT